MMRKWIALLEEDGLVDGLRAAGYTVELVSFS